MIDAKVANAMTETKSAIRCHLCKATSKESNNSDKMKEQTIDTSSWKCFECLLHIGYKLGIHKWQARGDTDKDIMKQRKSLIQKAFESELHLNIDYPKPEFGSSNDGNTARRFFENCFWEQIKL
ncbi:hypothetical protein JTB14_006424 [Gonioctena quinquepunctata]|nr:hypothetical protein JTB14_006424 [Gonioctena quinquepunctata]